MTLDKLLSLFMTLFAHQSDNSRDYFIGFFFLRLNELMRIKNLEQCLQPQKALYKC